MARQAEPKRPNGLDRLTGLNRLNPAAAGQARSTGQLGHLPQPVGHMPQINEIKEISIFGDNNITN